MFRTRIEGKNQFHRRLVAIGPIDFSIFPAENLISDAVFRGKKLKKRAQKSTMQEEIDFSASKIGPNTLRSGETRSKMKKWPIFGPQKTNFLQKMSFLGSKNAFLGHFSIKTPYYWPIMGVIPAAIRP